MNFANFKFTSEHPGIENGPRLKSLRRCQDPGIDSEVPGDAASGVAKLGFQSLQMLALKRHPLREIGNEWNVLELNLFIKATCLRD